ncbi:hypothetical protein D2Q93_06950, partial [Alicyclobacillaceae bacterium I2511]
MNSFNLPQVVSQAKAGLVPRVPQDLSKWPVQSPALAALHHQLQTGQVPHALLFVGSDLQTSSLADFMAQLLLCQAAPTPCGHCESCLQFVHENHPDFE